MNMNLTNFLNQSVGFILEIEANIKKDNIECYVRNANQHYCNLIRADKNKIIGINIKQLNDKFEAIYYQLIQYLFKNNKKDIFSLYVKKDNEKIEIMDTKKDYIYNRKNRFYEIMVCVLEQDSKFLRIFIIVRDISKKLDIINEVSKILEVDSYNDKIMNISEVVSNLTHSWRQPLNSLNFSIINFKNEIINKTGDAKLVNEYYGEIWSIIKNLSYKIEKFRTFFEIDCDKKDYNLIKSLNLLFEIMDEKIKRENIQICMDIKDDFNMYGSPNEFVQIMYCIFFDIVEYCKKVLDKYNRKLNICINKNKKSVVIDIKILFNREKYSDFKFDLEHISAFNHIIKDTMKGYIKLINNKTENKIIVSFPLNKEEIL